jgi:hypothetical protein
MEFQVFLIKCRTIFDTQSSDRNRRRIYSWRWPAGWKKVNDLATRPLAGAGPV